jgi:hypothetical protein
MFQGIKNLLQTTDDEINPPPKSEITTEIADQIRNAIQIKILTISNDIDSKNSIDVNDRVYCNLAVLDSQDEERIINGVKKKLKEVFSQIEINLIRLGEKNWECSFCGSYNLENLQKNCIPKFNAQLNTMVFKVKYGLIPKENYLNTPEFKTHEFWINSFTQQLGIFCQQSKEAFPECLINQEISQIFDSQMTPQTVKVLEKYFSIDGLICKLVENRDIYSGTKYSIKFSLCKDTNTEPEVHKKLVEIQIPEGKIKLVQPIHTNPPQLSS